MSFDWQNINKSLIDMNNNEFNLVIEKRIKDRTLKI